MQNFCFQGWLDQAGEVHQRIRTRGLIDKIYWRRGQFSLPPPCPHLPNGGFSLKIKTSIYFKSFYFFGRKNLKFICFSNRCFYQLNSMKKLMEEYEYEWYLVLNSILLFKRFLIFFTKESNQIINYLIYYWIFK